ncbi:MAG TPA: hypothetical protein VIJ40_02620 [Acidimicrobiales bacterium]
MAKLATSELRARFSDRPLLLTAPGLVNKRTDTLSDAIDVTASGDHVWVLDCDDLSLALERANAALTFSVFTSPDDEDAPWLIELGHMKAGRVIANGYPTGVGVSWSMQHGGPWPATTASNATSVGAGGIERWLRPIAYQSVPEELLPEALRDANPLGLPQRVDGVAR